MDHVADEVHEQPEETTANDVVLDAEGFPSGSHDTLVLIGYVHHVTVTVWNGKIFIFLNKKYFCKYLLLFLK